MQTICYSNILLIFNLLLSQHKGNQPLFGSLVLEAFLCLFIILMTLWSRDFWRDFSFLKAKGFRTQPKLKELFLFKYNLTAIFGQQQMVEPIPELPQSDKLPSHEDMAKLLVKGLPAKDREEAYTLLVTQLLPKKLALVLSPRSKEELALLSLFLEPRRLARSTYKNLASALQQTTPNQRLQLLRSDLCECEIKELIRNSFGLAMARYLKEHPEATNRARKRHYKRASQWQALSITELEQKASELSSEVKRWEKLVEAKHPELWEEYKLKSLNAQLNLHSASSGEFYVAMGELAIFLHAVEASFEELHMYNS